MDVYVTVSNSGLATGEDVEVLVQALNDGQIAVSGALEVAIYGDTGTELVELGREALGDNLDAGSIGPVKVFVFSAEEVLTYQDLLVTVDDTASSNECDETDNTSFFDVSAVCL